MFKLKMLIPALFLAAVMQAPAPTPASAAAVKPSIAVESSVIEVQARRDRRGLRRDRRDYRRGWRGNRRYYRGGYRRPPRGWRRYGYRPYNWRSRGCVVIGPLWFCP